MIVSEIAHNCAGREDADHDDDFVLLSSTSGRKGSVSCVQFFPGSYGERLVSSGDDCLIVGWNWLQACDNAKENSGELWSLRHPHKVNCLDIVCNDTLPEDLVVADVQSVITVYQSS